MAIQFSRLAAPLAAGALLLSVVGSVAAASPAKLTLSVADTTSGPTTGTGKAHVRVVHGSPDAPKVDVYAGATSATVAKVAPLSGLAFGQVSEYADVPAGTYAIKVCATADPSVCPIQVASLPLTAETYYTIAASGPLAAIKATVFTDTPAPSTDGAQVRVYHLSSDTPAVDVLTSTGGEVNPALDNLSYPHATGYVVVPPATYNLQVCAHADHSVCPLKDISLTVAAGHTYSVFAVGSLNTLLATPPSTSTDGDPASPAPWGSMLPLAALLFAFVVAAAGTLRYATVRNRR